VADPFDGAEWFDVGPLDEFVPERPVARLVGGVPLVLLRRPDESVVAFLDACPHRGVPLSETGRVLEDTLVCSVHFWRFSLPEGRQTHLPDVCLQRWPVRISAAGRVEVSAPPPG
jgi:phenylpropionate dioxygenase-like ring-hydroxylating dioxygenase large terminal subunit